MQADRIEWRESIQPDGRPNYQMVWAELSPFEVELVAVEIGQLKGGRKLYQYQIHVHNRATLRAAFVPSPLHPYGAGVVDLLPLVGATEKAIEVARLLIVLRNAGAILADGTT